MKRLFILLIRSFILLICDIIFFKRRLISVYSKDNKMLR